MVVIADWVFCIAQDKAQLLPMCHAGDEARQVSTSFNCYPESLIILFLGPVMLRQSTCNEVMHAHAWQEQSVISMETYR